jgi:hypothetical protein
MRLSSIAAALSGTLLAAAPAAAQPYPDEDVYREALPQQHEIERSADAMHRVLDALMQVRVGPLLEAADPEARHDRHRRHETLGDMARRDDPYFDERLHRSVEGVTQGMGEMMTRMARLAPALERTLEDVERSVDDAVRGVPESYPERYGD